MSKNLISQSDPSQRPHRTVSEIASTVPVWLPGDIVSLAPSSSAASQGGRSRSSSPSHSATSNFQHKILSSVRMRMLLAKSRISQCATKLPSESSWVNKVALPLLEGAISELPLECWRIHEDPVFSCFLLISSSQTESVDPQYQPRYTTRDTYNRKIDLVVDLPGDEYGKVGLHTIGRYFSHITHPHSGKRVLGPGVEIKAVDGNLVEVQVQIGRRSLKDLRPLVGCIVVGEDWKFYIAVGVQGSGVLKEVRIWGPLSDYNGRITTTKQTTSLLRTLRRVMEYAIGQYKDGISRPITSGV
ncbi:hypothetical protein N7463_008225 [Penicillium fimorum]|uniref:PD-(D/E)XK nuclease-like domain-containing protein n=1 Tax=Penicillium fimorum TaxID=1882269 RepID=A0A9X0C314_9EURO|nr:hypothetical protein N7463_008225 [Penicillium fimorum]